MERVDEYRFYELGQKIGAISKLVAENTFTDVWWSLWEARDALQALKHGAVAMRVSMPVVDRLIAAIGVIVPTNFNEAIKKDPDNTEKIGYTVYELNEALKAFEPVLAAECKALDTYVVSQKRGFVTSDLVDRADVMFGDDFRSWMPPEIMHDIRAAGRCLAFDTPTAAGFHILRACEAVMARYYTHLTGSDLPKQNRNWGLYLKKLEKVPQAEAKVRGALDHIKENYRNPITHPEVTLKDPEAIMLFGLCISVMEIMVDSIRNTTPALSKVEEAKALTEIAASAEPENF